MVDIVNISPGHDNVPISTAQTFRVAGAEWVVPTDGTLIAGFYGSLAAPPYGAFDHVGTSGFDVTIDSGEAAVGGACLARDATTSVTLASSTNNQTVYLGWQHSVQDSIVIGLDSDFSASEERLPIWEFDTDGSTVTAARDLRPVGQSNAITPFGYNRSEADSTFVSKDGGGLSDDLNFQQHQTVNRVVERRSSRPSNPVDWQEWVRTDTQPERHEIQTPNGVRAYELVRVDNVIETYDDGDLKEYSLVDSKWDVSTAAAKEGTYGAVADAGSYGYIISLDVDGLNHYPVDGETFEFWFNPHAFSGTPIWRIFFSLDETTRENCYRINFDDTGLRFDVIENDNITNIAGPINHSFVDGDWYRVVVDWGSNGDFVITLYDNGGTQIGDSMTVNDTTWQPSSDGTGAGIGSWTNNDLEFYLDEWKLVTN